MTVQDTVCSFENLYKSMRICKRSVGWKDSVIGWTRNGLSNCLKLKDSLYNGTYSINPYTKFTIHEPKKRNIVSTRFKDRVFQRSLCDNYLYDELTRHFIYDNCACQRGKGTTFAQNRLETHFHKYYRKYGSEGYILKMDIKDYFGSTRHDVAKEAVAKRCRDEWAIFHVNKIIDSFDSDKGMGLGSQVTQLIQLSVLDDLDHCIKEKLKVEHYIRYMDDMIIISNSKEELIRIKCFVERELSKIGLKLNQNKTQIFKISQGVKFLGFKFVLLRSGKVIRLVLKSNILRRKRKIIRFSRHIISSNGKIEDLDESFRSWLSHLDHGNCYKVSNRMKIYYRRRRNQVYEILEQRRSNQRASAKA